MTMTVRRSALLLLTMLPCAPAPARASEPAAPPCFAPSLVADLEAQAPRLMASADELARQVARAPGAPPMAVYQLTRQLALIERIQRRAQAHGEEICISALDGLQRDFGMLRSTAAAFAQGHAELGIERLSGEADQALLRELQAGIEPMQATIDALKWLGGG
jgi:hypothetical protein